MNIGFDVDGVLANFNLSFSKLCQEMYGTPLVEDISIIKDWDWDKWYPLTKDKIHKVWEKIKTREMWWCHLEPLVSGEVFKRINALCVHNNVYFITSRAPAGKMSLQTQTANWLGYHGIECPAVIPSNKKAGVCDALDIRYMIEDNFDNFKSILNYSSDTTCYLLKRPYNRIGQLSPNYGWAEVNTVEEYLDIIDRRG